MKSLPKGGKWDLISDTALRAPILSSGYSGFAKPSSSGHIKALKVRANSFYFSTPTGQNTVPEWLLYRGCRHSLRSSILTLLPWTTARITETNPSLAPWNFPAMVFFSKLLLWLTAHYYAVVHEVGKPSAVFVAGHQLSTRRQSDIHALCRVKEIVSNPSV